MPLFSPDPPILMNAGETGQLKRCVYIREAFQETFITSNTCAKSL